MAYFTDYPTKKIGKGNPYQMCSHCHNSEPYINGRIRNHTEYCEYRKMMESKGLAKEEIEAEIVDIDCEIEELQESGDAEDILELLYKKEALIKELNKIKPL
jgi:hypothetical protein